MTQEKAFKKEERDYNLASILSHALLGVETSGIFIQNALCMGDRELNEFFGEAQNQYRLLAERAKDLLARRDAQSLD